MKSKFRALKKKIFLQVVLTVVAAAAVGSSTGCCKTRLPKPLSACASGSSV